MRHLALGMTMMRSGLISGTRAPRRWRLSLARRLGLLLLWLALPAPAAEAATPVTHGVWLMDAKVAVRIFDCGAMLCGRVIWLIVPRDAQGVLDLDWRNPDAALRHRPLCGLTVLWDLHPTGPDRWAAGWFYNPFDGTTYRVSARLESENVLVARVYRGIPLFGQTKTLQRVVHGTVDGWC